MCDSTEYIFITSDGSKFYELVIERSDVVAFKSLHKADRAMPLWRYEELQENL